ncbi:hypothetical protein COLO4_16296 [Corchorus olitorius]|uniref:Secreted protein n=1 Tax=Corchorus olitorius TaxID=93759 RepID=A0A1R3JI47_9ROSI|nr:hypothetical protein COLO4_16296 [Corchorus olitorius]
MPLLVCFAVLFELDGGMVGMAVEGVDVAAEMAEVSWTNPYATDEVIFSLFPLCLICLNDDDEWGNALLYL